MHDDYLTECVGEILQDRHDWELHDLLISQEYQGDLDADPAAEHKRMKMELKSKHKQEVSRAITTYSRASHGGH